MLEKWKKIPPPRTRLVMEQRIRRGKMGSNMSDNPGSQEKLIDLPVQILVCSLAGKKLIKDVNALQSIMLFEEKR